MISSLVGSLINVIVFLITIAMYYILRPKLTVDILSNADEYSKYTSSNFKYLGGLFLLLLTTQMICNSVIINSNCSGSLKENIGYAGFITVSMWILFGAMLIILVLFPGLKSAFADVVGYFWIADEANNVLHDLLIDEEISKSIDKSNLNPTAKQDIETTAQTIIKIFGNKSILINQIVPINFNKWWNLLQPLMRPSMVNETIKKNEFFNLVLMRDNIGEALWYIYTGVLISLLVQMKITSRGCVNSSESMQKKYSAFKEEEAKSKKEEELANSKQYTITN
jgi:hypothetical protein